MWRNKRVVVIAVLAAVLLVTGIGAAVYANTSGTTSGYSVLNQAANTTSNNSLLARVAAILGIDQQTLQDAFQQARGDIQNERIDQYLANLVDQGQITQAQADSFKAWLQARPTSPDTTFQQYQDWLAARPADVPLPRGLGGPGACGGPVRGPAPAMGGGKILRGGMMGRF